jgi:hypothetical protein
VVSDKLLDAVDDRHLESLVAWKLGCFLCCFMIAEAILKLFFFCFFLFYLILIDFGENPLLSALIKVHSVSFFRSRGAGNRIHSYFFLLFSTDSGLRYIVFL